ncbi:MAG: hypothetical protein JWO69_1158 [Thermoleophilia bacterium]|jgi:hypothetical protein|nr:hypothetical protein [Thermoleophilia bacterium]
MRRRKVLIGVLAAATLLVAACSNGPTVGEYEGNLQRTMDDVEAAYGDPGDDPEQTRIALADAAERLDALEAPDELRDEHADLVSGVRDMSGAIRLLTKARAEAARDPERAEALTKQFADNDAFPRVEAAVTALREAGVDVVL